MGLARQTGEKGPAQVGTLAPASHTKTKPQRGNHPFGVVDDSATPNRGKAAVKRPAPPIWEGEQYANIPAGCYDALCVGIIGPTYLKRFHRYSLALRFFLINEQVEVCLFLNLGPDGKPKRGSKFFRAWTIANGDTPMKGQAMDLGVFTQEGLIYTIQVGRSTKDENGDEKPECLVYSRASEIVRVVRK